MDFFTSYLLFCVTLRDIPFPTHQYVQAGSFQQSDLVRHGQAREAWHSFSELHHLDDALGGQFTELVPEPQVQLDPVVAARVLRWGDGRRGGDRWERLVNNIITLPANTHSMMENTAQKILKTKYR